MIVVRSLLFTAVFTLVGCSSTPSQKWSPQSSYLEKGAQYSESELDSEAGSDSEAGDNKDVFSWAPKIGASDVTRGDGLDITQSFSDSEFVTLTADELKVNDFLRYVLGDLLGLNYILGNSAKQSTDLVTLSVSNQISKRRLYIMVEELLAEKGFVIKYSNDIFYVNNESTGAGGQNTAFGYGATNADVPTVSYDIVQMVPFSYGLKPGINTLLSQVANVRATPDFAQNIMVLKGKRKEVLKSLDFINMIDAPIFRDREVAIYRSSFVPVTELMEKLPALMSNDGFTVGTGAETTKSLSLVPIERQATLVMFANNKNPINRAHFWLQQIDAAADGEEKQYFVYQPRFARAKDLSQSLIPLLGGGNDFESRGRLNSSASVESGDAEEGSGNSNFSSEELTVVVDERSNAIIIHSTGHKYGSLLPLMKRLDVLPKQVMLEVLIVEVLLKDEFKQGVEFFLRDGNSTADTRGALGLSDIGGLNYLFSGTDVTINAKFFKDDSLTNVLSRPSIVVRDGVTARIDVGTDIPVVGAVTTDPTNGSTQSIQYRKTGVELNVTPTVNSQGVVIMEISQRISNSLTGGVTVAGAPSIFERTLETEVVADSGQTVILGGLISENTVKSKTKVPGLGDIPVLGALFSSEGDTTDKTELVVFVTPRIIESSDQWLEIKNAFETNFSHIGLPKNE